MQNKQWLIVGLGNPGKRYADTWHNAGFQVIDALAAQLNIEVRRRRFLSRSGQAKVSGKDCLLLKPATFMNNSGEAVRLALEYYRIPLDQCIVIYDDVDLPLGALRIRTNGGPGTHNGMKSVTRSLGSGAFIRIRLGIKPLHQPQDLATFVLSGIPKSLAESWKDVVTEAAQAVLLTLDQGVDAAMQDFNRKAGQTAAGKSDE